MLKDGTCPVLPVALGVRVCIESAVLYIHLHTVLGTRYAWAAGATEQSTVEFTD